MATVEHNFRDQLISSIIISYSKDITRDLREIIEQELTNSGRDISFDVVDSLHREIAMELFLYREDRISKLLNKTVIYDKHKNSDMLTEKLDINNKELKYQDFNDMCNQLIDSMKEYITPECEKVLKLLFDTLVSGKSSKEIRETIKQKIEEVVQ